MHRYFTSDDVVGYLVLQFSSTRSLYQKIRYMTIHVTELYLTFFVNVSLLLIGLLISSKHICMFMWISESTPTHPTNSELANDGRRCINCAGF